jgi:hypothetical protein
LWIARQRIYRDSLDKTRLALRQTLANFPPWEFRVKRLTRENDEN